MNNYNSILIAALGGAIIGGVIAALVGNKQDDQFPLSPSNDLDDFSGNTSNDYTKSELGSRPEMREVYQQS